MKNKILTFVATIAILLFGSITVVAQQTKINFNKNGETVFQSAISEIDSIIFKQEWTSLLIDISEETDWDYMVFGIDGSMILFSVDENSELPIHLYFKPDKNSDDGFTIFFKDNGLPDMLVYDDYILYYGNFRENLYDMALIHPDNSIEYFYDMVHDIDLSLSPSFRSKGLFGISLGSWLGIGMSVVTCGGAALLPMFSPALVPACATVVAGAVGNIYIDITYDDNEKEEMREAATIALCQSGAFFSCFRYIFDMATSLFNNDKDLITIVKAPSIAEAQEVINTPIITINTQPTTPINVTAGSITSNLSVSANVTHSATLSYQWYSSTTNSNTGGTVISGATSASFAIPTTLTVGTHYYFVEVNATGGAVPVRSNVSTVNVSASPVITISNHPTSRNVAVGKITGSLSVSASVPSGTLSYQWYSNTTNSNTGGTLISGAISASFAIPTTLTIGAYYYFVEISATGGAATVRSNVATVNVSDRFYIDEYGTLQIIPNSTTLLDYTTQTSLGTTNTTTWIRVNGTRTASGRITINGDVRIILEDGCLLNANNGGINVSGNNSLTIYAQSNGTNKGKLTANGSNGNSGGNSLSGGGGKGGNAGIGGNGGSAVHDSKGGNGINAGTIIINGGEITARGGAGGNGGSGWAGGGGGAGAGIGGGGGAGGASTAGLGSNGKAGGSGGSSGNYIAINGGTVIAYWGSAGSGGSRNGGNGGGGGGGRGAGIGGGGGAGGGGGYAAGGTGSAGSGGTSGSNIGNGGNGGSGGKGGTVVLVGGTNGGSGGSSGSGSNIYHNGSVTNGSDHIKITY